MKPGDRVKLPKAVAKIYEAVEELKAAYPGHPFTPDGHLIGSIGEVVAREIFGFDLYPPSNKGHDARCKTRGDVEVKITAGNVVAFRGDCNHLIVLRVVSPEAAELIYDGLGAPALRLAGSLDQMDSVDWLFRSYANWQRIESKCSSFRRPLADFFHNT